MKKFLDKLLGSLLVLHLCCFTKQEKSQQLRDFRSLLAERDKIGAQLIKQSERIALQQDKIRLQESAMQVSPICLPTMWSDPSCS